MIVSTLFVSLVFQCILFVIGFAGIGENLVLASSAPNNRKDDSDWLPQFEVPQWDSSAMRTIFTLDAGNYLAAIVGELFESGIKEVPIPDFSGDFKTSSGIISYAVTNIVVSQVSVGTPVFSTDPSAQLVRAEMLGNTLELTFDYAFKQKSWPYQSAEDIGSLSVTDLGIIAAVRVNRKSDTGQPNMEVAEVQISLNEFSLHIDGGAFAWVINAFSDIFEEDIAKAISEMFTEVATAVAEQLAGDLGETGMSECRGDLCYDGRYGADPAISDRYISLLQGGTWFYGPDQSHYQTPEGYTHVPEIVDNSWVQVLFGPPSVETYIEAMQYAGFLGTWTASASTYGAPLDAASVAVAFPELAAKYPGSDVQVTWRVDECADVSGYPACVLMSFLATLTITPLDPSTHAPIEDAIVLSVYLDTDATLNWRGAHEKPIETPVTENQGSLSWKVVFDYVELETVSSTVGNLSLGSAAESWFETLFTNILKPNYFDKAFDSHALIIPIVMSCTYIDRRIFYNRDYVGVGFSLENCI